MTPTAWAVIVAAALIVAYAVYAYNRLISLENRVDNAWSQISVQLKRRSDLIPNLVQTAERYADHESNVFTSVSDARKQLNEASTPQENAEASDALTASLRQLFAVAEDYPELKADTNYMQIQEELSSTENKIAYARQHYNDVTTEYNTSQEVFPTNIVANTFRFQQRELFQPPQDLQDDFSVTFDS